MAGRIKIKHVNKVFAKRPTYTVVKPQVVEGQKETSTPANEGNSASKAKKTSVNKKDDETETAMLTQEQLEKIEATVKQLQPEVKVLKKERGLIERTESSKIVLTEDNRQVLTD